MSFLEVQDILGWDRVWEPVWREYIYYLSCWGCLSNLVGVRWGKKFQDVGRYRDTSTRCSTASILRQEYTEDTGFTTGDRFHWKPLMWMFTSKWDGFWLSTYFCDQILASYFFVFMQMLWELKVNTFQGTKRLQVLSFLSLWSAIQCNLHWRNDTVPWRLL